MTVLDEIPVGPDARVYAEGWQSWSPTTWYARGDAVHRPEEPWQHAMRFRPGTDVAEGAVQGEGLLVVDPGEGSAARVFGTLDASREVPTLRASWQGDRIVVETEGTGDGLASWTQEADGADARATALASFGDRFGAASGARLQPRSPRVWCTWYQYFEEVGASDVIENLTAIDETGLDVDVVQIDDGWSLGTGEWTAPNPRFGSLPDAVEAIRATGRRAGIWAAPFSVAATSTVATEHPEWVLGDAGRNWGDDLRGLDLTHPGVRDYLARVFTDIRELGIDYVKLDFLYSGALPGTRWDADATPISAYRSGLALIRDVLGDEAFLLGCGAPILPSVGLVDAMRVSGDTFHEGGEDGSQGLRGRMSLEARSWQHDRFWTNDPDCLVARPQFALREEWAEVVQAAPGIRGFSDRIGGLDARGIHLVRELLKETPV
ncbi:MULTISPECIES: glycoside hydrolase family 36 protein [unclassified Microbacterium]|uniref:glycoside hydrolase family 36 protein n=1 Tax=unclassified Microbacterium TaxID=2609290 RepID=UPI000EA88B57|nr:MULTISPECIES: glycoside hydrolase family 36 protein [unclassified Microbacterium]MBT2483986.1 alpha-galactosidase [Microbacterium sp. ISL-108]RKN66949.1 alpha-galactosidase [Microbacterium sp. CGR2]